MRITAGTDKQEYLIGDYIRLNITVHNTAHTEFIFPPAGSIAPEFEIINISTIDTVKQQNDQQLKEEIVYSIYDSGVYKINPIFIPYKKENDTATYFATTDTIRFIVNTVPVDTTQEIKPIKPIMEVHVKSKLWLYILCAVAGLIALAVLLYFILRKRKQRPVPEVQLTPETLYEQTFNKLLMLDEKKLWQHEQVKEYYTELTDILRDYIERRYSLPAMESTSDEIIELLVRAAVKPEQIQHMNNILQSADFAKFARSKPLAAENTLAMQYAKEFVGETKQQENNTDKAETK